MMMSNLELVLVATDMAKMVKHLNRRLVRFWGFLVLERMKWIDVSLFLRLSGLWG
jgi:hypothetical protein